MGLNRIEEFTSPSRVFDLCTEVNKPVSTADLVGFDGTIVEGRIAPVDDQVEAKHVLEHPVGPHYAAKDAMEAAADLSVTDAIAPAQVDKDFLAYLDDVFYHRPVVHGIDVTSFTTETVVEIMDRYNSAGKTVFYNMWVVDGLPLEKQLIPPDAQRLANAKGALRQTFPPEILPKQIVLDDPRIRTSEKTVFDLTDDELRDLKGEGSRVWFKGAAWGLGGEGVISGATVEEMIRFYNYLVDLGVRDATIIVEQDLPGEGGSFTLIRRMDDGRVVFNSVTKQLSDEKGRRTGNIIYDSSRASPAMVRLINTTVERLANSNMPPGVYTFDNIEDADGVPRLHDPANRKTGTTPTAFHRMYFIGALNLLSEDTVTGMQRLYLDPHTTFADVMRAFDGFKLTDWVKGRIVSFRQFINAYGRASFHLALTTTDREKLPVIEKEVVQALNAAGIQNSPTPLP